VDLGMGFEFVIALDDVTISISAEALEAISEQATGETILISVESVEKNVLNEKQSSALAEIKDKSVAQVLQAFVISDGKTISDFKGGKVGVELPYKLGSGWDKDDFAMLYVSDEGKTEDIPLDHKNDAFHMTLTHFSEYVLMKSNSGHGGGEIAQPTPTPNPGATGGDVDTGDDFSILLWAAVLVVAVVGVVLTVVLLRRKRDQ